MIISCFRIGRLGRLTVHSLAEEPASPKTKISAVGFSVMTLGNSTEFYVSGVPAGYEVRFLNSCMLVVPVFLIIMFQIKPITKKYPFFNNKIGTYLS